MEPFGERVLRFREQLKVLKRILRGNGKESENLLKKSLENIKKFPIVVKNLTDNQEHFNDFHIFRLSLRKT